jgi:pimeloyl-ACP methyl ester carboxylesterase
MASRALPVSYKSTNVRSLGLHGRRLPLWLSLAGRLAPGFAGRFVKRSFFTPATPAPGNLAKQYLATGRRFYFQVHDKKICGRQWGQGPGILFVHGWNGLGVQFCHFFETLLNNGYRVVTYDGPAHGESQGKTTNYFEIADTVSAFFDQVEEHDVKGVIAHSLGASAVINHLATRQSDIEAVLIAPAMQPGKILRQAFKQHGVPRKMYEKLIAELECRYGYSLLRDSPHLLARQITSRVLIVHDKDDRTTPHTDSRTIAENINNIVLHTTTGLGHKRILGDPDILDLVQAYILERCGGRQISQLPE